MELNKAILSSDSRTVNQALKSLYLDSIVNAKVNQWSRDYNLKNKEPDDIIQEGIIILLDKIQKKSFRGESSVKTFLLGICKFLILGSVKKKEILDFQEHFQEGSENFNIPKYDHFEDIEKTEEEATRDKTLMKVIEQMDEKCSNALKLFYYEKLKMAEVAIKTNLANANQAKKAVSRCRQKLRSIIQANPTLIKVLN